MGRLHGYHRRRHARDVQIAGGHRSAAGVITVGYHRIDRLLRRARYRSAESGRDFRGVGRGGCDRFGGRDDREIKGCRVIGIAGGSKKCAWLTDEAGYDGAIDYKGEDVGAALSRLCPKGIDIYFDNVGGEILDHAMARLANGARVVLCGGISQYNAPEGMFGGGPKNYFNLILRNARMEGFIVLKFSKRFPEAAAELGKWLAEGKIENQLDVAHGLENAPKTIVRLFTGANFGNNYCNSPRRNSATPDNPGRPSRE